MTRATHPSAPVLYMAISCWLVLTLEAPLARGENAGAERAAAQDLFDQAQALMGEQQYSDACAKFEASYQLVAGAGTRFYLADCYEKAGLLASAWAHFRAVADISRTQGNAERAEVAEQRANALLRRLSYVTIVVHDPAPGLIVKRDGIEVPSAAWGIALPLDNREHQIEATAPGKRTLTLTVTLDREGSTIEVVVPALEGMTQTPPPALASVPGDTAPAAQPQSNRKAWAIVSGAVGLVGLGIGASMVLSAEHTYSSAACSDDRCSKSGVDDRRSAIHVANWSMLPLGIGLMGVGTGLTLWFTEPAATRDKSHMGLVLAPSQLGLRGDF